MGNHIGERPAAEVGSPSGAGAVAALLRNRAVVGSASALVGLSLGILLGRASVIVRGDGQPLARLEHHAQTNPKTPAEAVDEPIGPSTEYRRHLGRKLPKGSKGFTRARIGRRPVGQLAGERSTLNFDIAPSDASYVVTVVAGVDGATIAPLQIELDGKRLGEANLVSGWGMYAAAVPAGLLSSGTHELAFHSKASSDDIVGIESIAVVQAAPAVELTLNTSAIGSMIDGFSGPSRDSVWSHGQRSALGLVLSKAEGGYGLKLRAAAISKLAPLAVTARVNGKEVGTRPFPKQVTDVEWELPANTLQPGVNRIEFSYPETATPSEYDAKSKDNRPLALRFYRLSLQPNQ